MRKICGQYTERSAPRGDSRSMVGRRSWKGLAGPAGRTPGPAEAGVSAALPEVGRRHQALGTRARGPQRSIRPCPAARAEHRAGAGAGVAAGAGAGVWSEGTGSGQRVRLGGCLALRPSIGRNRLCRSLWLKSPSLSRRAAAIGRAAPTSASSAGGFFKGEADRSVRQEPPPGLARTALAPIPPPPRPASANRTAPACSGRCTWGEAPPRSRAGACVPLGGLCSVVCSRVRMRVPACACVCPRERGRVCEDAGVCAQMRGVCRPSAARARGSVGLPGSRTLSP